jgi:cyclic pyranopterin phosphate synthase
MTGLSDFFQRPINYLRISVTDRCNLRCVYCMPPSGVNLLPRSDMLSYEEIVMVARAAAGVGISKIRISGGEPLVRSNLPQLIAMLNKIDGIDDLALSTNALLLEVYAAELKNAGLRRVNISLDSLKPDRFEQITRVGNLNQVLQGIEAAKTAGLHPVKINMVVLRGINDDEVLDFALKSQQDGWNVRFIELMPMSNTGLSSHFVSTAEIKQRLTPLGELQPCQTEKGNGPARYFRLLGANGTIGFISPISEHFCFGCNRLRLTADGKLRPCLLSDEEIDLRQKLRIGTSIEELAELIRQAAAAKPQRHNLEQGGPKPQRPMAQVGG